MDDWTQQDLDSLKAYLNEPDRLVDLYYAIPADQYDPLLTGHTSRFILLLIHCNLSAIEPWANAELRLLLNEMLERGEEVPEIMIDWALRFAAGTDGPVKTGRPSEARRNLKMLSFLETACANGYKRKHVIELFCRALYMTEASVKSALRRAKGVRNKAQIRILR